MITLDEAAKIAVELSEHLEAKEQAFFIAGFQECVKYMSNQTMDADKNLSDKAT